MSFNPVSNSLPPQELLPLGDGQVESSSSAVTLSQSSFLGPLFMPSSAPSFQPLSLSDLPPCTEEEMEQLIGFVKARGGYPDWCFTFLDTFKELFFPVTSQLTQNKRSVQLTKDWNRLLTFFLFLVTQFGDQARKFLRKTSEQTAQLQEFDSVVLLCHSREKVVQAYNKEIKPYFSLLQKFSNVIFCLLVKARTITPNQEYGIVVIPKQKEAADIGDLGFYRDSGGYVPFQINVSSHPRARTIHYGETAAVQSQHFTNKVFVPNSSGVLEEHSGLLILNQNANEPTLRRCLLHFVHGKNTCYPFTLSRYALSCSAPEELRSLFASSADEFLFIPFPDSRLEWDLLELAFLESLQGEPVEGLEANQGLIEWTEADIEDLKTETTNRILTDDEYQRMIEEEQQAIQEQVIRGTAGDLKHSKGKKFKGKGKKPKGKGKKPAPMVAADKPIIPTAKKPIDFLKDLKEKKILKYRKFLGLLNHALRHSPPNRLRQCISGSHHMLHGESSGATIVRPHGSRDEVPQHQAKRCIEKIVQLALSADVQ